MQQPTRYYISRSGDEPTLRSVRIAQPQAERACAADPDLSKSDARAATAGEACFSREGYGASVKERLQEAIRKHATTR